MVNVVEDTSNVVDEMLTWEVDEYVAILTTCTEARDARAKARIARGFYPVVVPADSGTQPRYGRKGGKGKGKEIPHWKFSNEGGEKGNEARGSSKGKGQGKGKDKGKSKGKGKNKGKGKGKGKNKGKGQGKNAKDEMQSRDPWSQGKGDQASQGQWAGQREWESESDWAKAINENTQAGHWDEWDDNDGGWNESHYGLQ